MLMIKANLLIFLKLECLKIHHPTCAITTKRDILPELGVLIKTSAETLLITEQLPMSPLIWQRRTHLKMHIVSRTPFPDRDNTLTFCTDDLRFIPIKHLLSFGRLDVAPFSNRWCSTCQQGTNIWHFKYLNYLTVKWIAMNRKLEKERQRYFFKPLYGSCYS